MEKYIKYPNLILIAIFYLFPKENLLFFNILVLRKLSYPLHFNMLFLVYLILDQLITMVDIFSGTCGENTILKLPRSLLCVMRTHVFGPKFQGKNLLF